ncbi:MAG: hypothetical protein H6607_10485 [Flavobacteriales bacterium]|nr:hypothetical protein [Flavobacteriales bacterium]
MHSTNVFDIRYYSRNADTVSISTPAEKTIIVLSPKSIFCIKYSALDSNQIDTLKINFEKTIAIYSYGNMGNEKDTIADSRRYFKEYQRFRSKNILRKHSDKFDYFEWLFDNF